MKLRIATNNDCEEIIVLIAEVLKEYDLPLFLDSSDAELHDIWGNYSAKGGIFKVLENEQGKIIGTVALRGINKQVCELRRMYLRSETRGRGLGNFLLLEAITKARSLGFSRVVLDTSSSLKEAIGLYRKFGFEPVQPLCPNKSCDLSFSLDLWSFEKDNSVKEIKYPWENAHMK